MFRGSADHLFVILRCKVNKFSRFSSYFCRGFPLKLYLFGKKPTFLTTKTDFQKPKKLTQL